MTRTPAHRLFLALAGSPLDARPDAELLDRFARYGERPALDAVVRRHAGLVRGVCRRHLGPTADADDAFQATFLVLLRHVGRGRPPAKVGPWLYAVAVRTSARLRSRRKFAPLPEVAARPAEPVADWLPLLDRELNGLPAKYRDALVLCELQGKSRREAATLLGIAEGTLSSRLSRGRELLRRRLLKHGTLLPAAGLGLAAGEAASAELLAATVGLADGAVSAAVAAAVPPAGWGLWKLLAGVAMVAGLAGGLALVPGDEKPKADEPAKPAAVAAKPAGPAVPDAEALQGLWTYDEFLFSEAGKRKVLTEFKNDPAVMDAELAAIRNRSGLVVAGDHWWLIRPKGEDAEPVVARLQPGRNPKWLDLTRVPGLSSARRIPDGFSMKAVYDLRGDRLVLATSDDFRFRPAELGPSDDPERVLVAVYRRAPAPTPAQLAAVKPLLGHWKLASGKHNTGGDGSVRAMTDGWLEVTPYALFLRWGQNGAKHFNEAGPLVQAATYTLDPTKSHPWIDLRLLTTYENGKPGERYGVYELAGDTLRLVIGREKAFRPLDFEVQPDTTKGELKGPNPQTEAFEFKRAAP